MKTAREIIEKHNRLRSGSTFIGIHEAMKEFALEVAKESLKNASDNLIEWSYERYPNFKTARESVTNEWNIPKLD